MPGTPHAVSSTFLRGRPIWDVLLPNLAANIDLTLEGKSLRFRH